MSDQRKPSEGRRLKDEGLEKSIFLATHDQEVILKILPDVDNSHLVAKRTLDCIDALKKYALSLESRVEKLEGELESANAPIVPENWGYDE